MGGMRQSDGQAKGAVGKADPEYNRLIWHSRRGMLELDLVLGPFVRKKYPELAENEQALYRQLLDCEDQDLMAWLLRREQPGDPGLQQIVKTVLQFSGVEVPVGNA